MVGQRCDFVHASCCASAGGFAFVFLLFAALCFMSLSLFGSNVSSNILLLGEDGSDRGEGWAKAGSDRAWIPRDVVR